MVKYRPKVKGYDSGAVITTKSPYGSHADMVVEDHDVQNDFFEKRRVIGEHEVICKDDIGYYITLKARLDNGLSDPNRYVSREGY
jgi:hypothetical protein